MFNSLDKIVYFIGFMIILIIRKYFTAKHRKMNLSEDKKSLSDIIFLALNGVGMIIPLVYVFSSVLDFADYPLPGWLLYPGAVLFLGASWLLWQSHYHLEKNWTQTLGIQKEHQLVTTGIYKYIRHPMYAAHILWALAQILMLPNFIAGFSFMVVIIPHYLSRYKNEEQMMIQRFGDQYKEYMTQSGRIFPRIFKK